MKIKINLTREEYDYLKNDILENHKKFFSQLTFSKNVNDSIDMECEESIARNILKLVGDKIRLCFNKDYKLTKSDSILGHLTDKLYKIEIEINLTKEEYDYLINNLLRNDKEILSKLIFIKKDNLICIKLEAGVADDIRELAGNEVGLHFDENYEPTKDGWILEHLLDKFYF